MSARRILDDTIHSEETVAITNETHPSSYALPKSKWFLGAIVLVTSVIASIGLALIAEHFTSERRSDSLGNLATRIKLELRANLERHIDPLYALKYILEAKPDENRSEFHDMLTPWVRRLPDMYALEWVEHIQSNRKSDFIIRDSAHSTDFPDRIGLTYSQDPYLLETAEQSILTSRPQMIVDIESGTQKTLQIIAPVYGPFAGTNGVMGLASGIYDLEAILTATLKNVTPNMASEVVLHRLTDIGEELLFSHYSFSGPEDTFEKDKTFVTTFRYASEEWRLRIRHIDDHILLSLHSDASLVFFGGLLFSLVLALYILSLQKNETRIRALVEKQTEDAETARENAVKARYEAEIALSETYQASQAKNRFLAHMSHELRSPLNAIHGYATLMLRDQKIFDDREEVRQYITTISHASDQLMRTIGDILDHSKIEANQLALETVTFNIKELIEELTNFLSLSAEERNNRIAISIDESVPDWVSGDPTRIRQILMNLLSNSIKFTENGLIKIKLDTKEHNLDGQILRFSVIDQGIGIKQDKLSLLFEEFTQADSSITREFGGTGLGLSISRALIKAMQGNIGVKSTYGQGATFWFDLPLPEAEAPNAGAYQKSVPDLPLLDILLVEDIEVNRHMTSRLLKQHGHTVDLASNGLEAVELCKTKHYAVILMDIHMPEMDGITATRTILANLGRTARHPIIIALTADVSGDHIALYHQAGMVDICAKPLDIDHLMVLISHHYHPDIKRPSPSLASNIPPLSPTKPEIRLDEERFFNILEHLPDAIDLFEKDAHDLLNAAMAYCQKEDWRETKTHLHSLKGASANMGFSELNRLCRKAELNLGSSETHEQETIRASLRDVEEALKEALHFARKAQQRHSS